MTNNTDADFVRMTELRDAKWTIYETLFCDHIKLVQNSERGTLEKWQTRLINWLLLDKEMIAVSWVV